MRFLITLKFLMYIEVILVAVFITGHSDVQGLVNWGYQLILTTQNGDITNFSNVLLAKGNPTNYTMLCNIFMALAIFPVYLFTKATENVSYWMCYKFILAIFTIFSSKIINDIVKSLGFDKRGCALAEILYLSSTFVQPISVMFGQIDFVSNFFLLYGIKYLIKNNISKSFIFFSISYCFKPFPVIIIFPILCMLFYKIKKNLISHGMILSLPYLFMSFLTYIFIDNFYINASKVNTSINFYYRLISYHNYIVPSLITVLLLILLFKSKKYSCDIKKLLTFPLLAFSLFTLQIIHYQWELYEAAPFIILIMLLIRKNFIIGIFAYIFINILQILKYLSWGALYYSDVFYLAFYRKNLTVNFHNYIYEILHIHNNFNIKILYVVGIFFLVWLVNRKKIGNNTLGTSNYVIFSILSLIPLAVYVVILTSFIKL